MDEILLPFPPGCFRATLVQRVKRFSIAFAGREGDGWAHTNNSGAMLGLARAGTALWLSPAPGLGRKLPYTLELVGLPGQGGDPRETAPPEAFGALPGAPGCSARPQAGPEGSRGAYSPSVMWVGVNTLTPNRLLRAAFAAGRLPWAAGYTHMQPEARCGQSRLDALLTGPGLPPLWVECKNVTLVEDGVAAFPDAVTERGQKHVREMMAIVASGERAAFFYCVQRKDARCFGPADYIDPAYAALFYEGLCAGVEVYPHLVPVSPRGIGLGALLPLAPAR